MIFNMKKLINPTEYFSEKMDFHQVQKLSDNKNQEIQQLVNKLLDRKKCILCKNNYDIHQRVPRILVHCGHTFCTECLSQFHMNKRVRCPSCLKLIKKLINVSFLPINHTIYDQLFKINKAKQLSELKDNNQRGYQLLQIQIKKNANKDLYREFVNNLRENMKAISPPEEDSNVGLPYCVYHPQKVQHYFCIYHESPGCKKCMSEGHQQITSNCRVINVYQIREQYQKDQYTTGHHKNHEMKTTINHHSKYENKQDEDDQYDFEKDGGSDDNSSSSSDSSSNNSCN